MPGAVLDDRIALAKLREPAVVEFEPDLTPAFLTATRPPVMPSCASVS
jgi:hypothetical protein